MTRVVIAGAGGFGRGLYSWLIGSPNHLKKHNIEEIVFIDDSQPRLPAPANVVSTVANYSPAKSDLVLCAIASPTVRQNVVETLAARSARFHTFVDDRAILAHGVDVGEGAVVCPGVTISANAEIAPHVHINFNCSVGHDAKVGMFSTLSPSVNVMGEVVIGRGVFLGGSCTVLPRIEVASSAVVGAGAVVLASVGAGLTMVGNPARALSPKEH